MGRFLPPGWAVSEMLPGQLPRNQAKISTEIAQKGQAQKINCFAALGFFRLATVSFSLRRGMRWCIIAFCQRPIGFGANGGRLR